MTLVLVISMSTATYAWYTSNNTVKASVTTIEAATSSGNLRISLDGTSYSTAVTETVKNVLNPVCPSEVLDSTKAAGEYWLTGKLAGDGTATVSGPAAAGTNVVTGKMYLNNDAQEETGAITMTLTGAAVEGKEGIEVADIEYLFIDSNGVLWGTSYSYGKKADANEPQARAEAVSAGITKLAANQTVEMNYYIWLDGWDVVNADQGKALNLTFTFSAAA